jgi:UPF0755 protein
LSVDGRAYKIFKSELTEFHRILLVLFMQRIYKIYFTCGVIFLAGLIWLLINWVHFIKTPLLSVERKPITFLYKKGTSVKRLAFDLYKLDVTKHPGFFWTLAHLSGSWRALQPGEYIIVPGIKPMQLLQDMLKGEKNLHAFTIVEGWTFQQLFKSLADNPYIVHTLVGLDNNAVMKTLGHNGEFPEGRFAPETYLFHVGTLDTEILKIAYNLSKTKLTDAWHRRDSYLPYHCPYEALIAASIIEKETAVEEERAKVAGVITRRLKIRMHLDMDPTVIYGIYQDFNAKNKLKASDLKINTAYNTYIHYGLPPTPIATPSQSAIDAALHPADGDALYFVTRGDGTHKFSASLHAQSLAIKKYLKKESH